jgi:hypothetical protein
VHRTQLTAAGLGRSAVVNRIRTRRMHRTVYRDVYLWGRPTLEPLTLATADHSGPPFRRCASRAARPCRSSRRDMTSAVAAPLEAPRMSSRLLEGAPGRTRAARSSLGRAHEPMLERVAHEF